MIIDKNKVLMKRRGVRDFYHIENRKYLIDFEIFEFLICKNKILQLRSPKTLKKEFNKFMMFNEGDVRRS